MLEDESIATDNDGPRGYKRLWVKTKDVIMKYENLAERARVEGSSKMSKDATAEQISSKMKLAVSGGVKFQGKDGDATFMNDLCRRQQDLAGATQVTMGFAFTQGPGQGQVQGQG